MSGLVYKVGDFEIDLMRVWRAEGDYVVMDDYKRYGVGTEIADAVRMIISGQPVPVVSERPQGTCGTAQGACPSPNEAPGRARSESSAVREQPDSQSSVITSFPGDKAPEQDAAGAAGGATENGGTI